MIYGAREKINKAGLRIVPAVKPGLRWLFDKTERHSAAAGCCVLTVHLR